MKTRIIWILTVFLVALICICFIQEERVRAAKNEAERQRNNTEALLSDIDTYRTRDSLSAAQVQSLTLTIKDFERYRADDAETIRTLKAKNRELASVASAQAQTIIALQGRVADTVIIVKDSIVIPAKAVSCGDEWYTFSGIVTEDEFSGKVEVKESLTIVESVKHKRFLWWKLKKIKDRKLDVVSKNPYTTIQDVEHIIIGN